jgi:dolichyl-phosphate beta-glucosyltransferase
MGSRSGHSAADERSIPMSMSSLPSDAAVTKSVHPVNPFVLSELRSGELRSEAAVNRDIQVVVLTIVVPMYNESLRIKQSIETLASSSLNRGDVQFVFVDDGSTDATVETVAQLVDSPSFHRKPDVVALSRNHGKGAAVRTGMMHSRSAYTGFIDADLSLNPSVVDELLQQLMSTEADVIVGYRVVNPQRQPRIRRLMSLTFTAITARIAPTGVRDTQCACKIFTADAVTKTVEPMVTEGFAFDVELLLRARHAGLRVIEHPVHWRHSAGSRVNQFIAPFLMVKDVIKARRMISRGR